MTQLGYLLKSTHARQLADAMRIISQGCSQLGPTIAPRVFAQLNPINTAEENEAKGLLSEREREIISLLGEGKNNQEIVQALHLSQGNVLNHISRILSGLGLRDSPKERHGHRTQAALLAHKHL